MPKLFTMHPTFVHRCHVIRIYAEFTLYLQQQKTVTTGTSRHEFNFAARKSFIVLFWHALNPHKQVHIKVMIIPSFFVASPKPRKSHHCSHGRIKFGIVLVFVGFLPKVLVAFDRVNSFLSFLSIP